MGHGLSRYWSYRCANCGRGLGLWPLGSVKSQRPLCVCGKSQLVEPRSQLAWLAVVWLSFCFLPLLIPYWILRRPRGAGPSEVTSPASKA
jgi:DNA-directed RNA polymerase subunit RPC12/RpoP